MLSFCVAKFLHVYNKNEYFNPTDERKTPFICSCEIQDTHMHKLQHHMVSEVL